MDFYSISSLVFLRLADFHQLCEHGHLVCSGTMVVVKYNRTEVSTPRPCWSKKSLLALGFAMKPMGNMDRRVRWWTVWPNLAMKKRAQCYKYWD